MNNSDFDDFDDFDQNDHPSGNLTQKINPLIIAGGFVGGLLFGGFQFWQYTDNAAVVRAESPTVQAPVAAPRSSAPASRDLVRENERLKQELAQVKLQNELARARRELAKLKRASGAAVRRSRPAVIVAEPSGRGRTSRNPDPSGKETKGQRTLEYWNRMNAIFTQEAAMRSAPSGGLTAANAADFLQRRSSAGEFAVRSLRELDPTNVDREVVQLSQEIAGWYKKGARSNEIAGGLLGAGRKTRQGSRGKQWKSAEKSHRNQIEVINRKGERLRAKMSKKYGLSFPPMQ